jgi:hypothetical protein
MAGVGTPQNPGASSYRTYLAAYRPVAPKARPFNSAKLADAIEGSAEVLAQEEPDVALGVHARLPASSVNQIQCANPLAATGKPPVSAS